MRVGVFVGGSLAEEGGGTTLRTGIANALKASSCRHEFILFYPGDNNRPTLDPAPPVSSFQKMRRSISSHRVLGPIARFAGHVFRQAQGESAFHERNGQAAISCQERFVRDFAIDVVWLLMPWSEPISVPYIATVYDLEHRKQPYFPEVSTTGWRWDDRERNYRRLLPRAARVVTGTSAGKKEIVSFYGVNPDNVHVVPFPVDGDFDDVSADKLVDIRRKCDIANAFLFYPAQFWPHKNHVNLLLALGLLNANSEDPLQLVLTGSDKGNLQYVKETAHRLGLEQQVRILGFVSREDLFSLYRQAVALVFPSFFGPDNLPPLEAFATGCPVVAARVAGADEQLGDAAILFDPPVQWRSRRPSAGYARMQALRAELIRRGLEQVAARTTKNYVERICDMLDDFEPIRRCWGENDVHT